MTSFHLFHVFKMGFLAWHHGEGEAGLLDLAAGPGRVKASDS